MAPGHTFKMTRNRKITPDAWEKITSSACCFQVVGSRECLMTEQSTTPDETTAYKIALPWETYNYSPNPGEALYMKSIDTDAIIAYDKEG